MDWIERLNQSMEYIEENLNKEIDYDALERIGVCSRYHF